MRKLICLRLRTKTSKQVINMIIFVFLLSSPFERDDILTQESRSMLSLVAYPPNDFAQPIQSPNVLRHPYFVTSQRCMLSRNVLFFPPFVHNLDQRSVLPCPFCSFFISHPSSSPQLSTTDIVIRRSRWSRQRQGNMDNGAK